MRRYFARRMFEGPAWSSPGSTRQVPRYRHPTVAALAHVVENVHRDFGWS